MVGKVLLDLESRGLYDNSAERFYALDIESVIDSTELVKECEANLERLELRACTYPTSLIVESAHHDHDISRR